MQVLTAHPEGICDDCVSKLSGVVPRQTVHAICSAQNRNGAILRERRKCPQDSCHKTKLVNVLVNHSGDGGAVPKTLPFPVPDSGALREQTVVLCDHLHAMNEILRRLDNAAHPSEPFAACVTRLRKAGILPGKVAAMMLTINAMRVEVVKERRALPADEWAVVQAIWQVLGRWKMGLSPQMGKAGG